MALFFDQTWFDEALTRVHLNKETVAGALGLDLAAVEEIWKDQRELKPEQVETLAMLLGQPVEEVVNRAGVATPLPEKAAHVSPELAARLDGIESRLARIEADIAQLLALMAGRSS